MHTSLSPFFIAFIMYRVLRSSHQVQAHWKWHSRTWFNLLNYRRVIQALIQSAAMYSLASISLIITFFLSPNIGYVACLSIFSPLIVGSCVLMAGS